MDDLKKIIVAYKGGELDKFYEKYERFYYYMKLMEELAFGIYQGRIIVPK